MTFAELEHDVLSVRMWMRRTVLPVALLLLVVLAAMWQASGSRAELDHLSLFVALMALWFVLVRGGHLLMVRSLHKELKSNYPEPYAERLAPIPHLRRRNAGFTLARIKRALIDDGVIANPNVAEDAFPKSEDFRE